MEARLEKLRATMASERERRENNPAGAIWGSARSDIPNGQKYVQHVLENRKPPDARPPLAAARPAVPHSVTPLLEPSSSLHEPSSSSAAAADDDADPFAGTKPMGSAMFEWNPAAALPGDGDEYEELLGPEGGDDLGGGGGGGSLLDGAYDEGESAASFQDAVAAWRAGNAAPAPAAGGGAFGGTATSGSLLDGAFDEDESAASFQEALRAFRGGGGGASTGGASTAGASTAGAARAPRFQAGAPPPPTLAQKVAAVGRELGVPSGLPLAEAVAQANAIAGFDAEGTLLEQVQRLVVQTGVSVGAAAEAAGTRAPPKQPPRPAAAGTQAGARPSYYQLLQRDIKDAEAQKERDAAEAARRAGF